MRCLTLMLFLICGVVGITGCQPGSAPPTAAKSEQQANPPPTTSPSSATEPAVEPPETGRWNQFLDRSQKLRDDATKSGGELLESGKSKVTGAYASGREWTSDKIDRCSAEWKSRQKELIEISAVLVAANATTADKGLRLIESKRGESLKGDDRVVKGLARYIVAVGPGCDGIPKYSDSRLLYRDAVAESDAEKRAELHRAARRMCLLAMIKSGIGVATLGSGGLVDKLAEAAEKLLGAVEIFECLSVCLPSGQIEQLTPVLDGLLSVPSISRTVDVLLSWTPQELADSIRELNKE